MKFDTMTHGSKQVLLSLRRRYIQTSQLPFLLYVFSCNIFLFAGNFQLRYCDIDFSRADYADAWNQDPPTSNSNLTVFQLNIKNPAL